jgi:Arc/MetJ family transcription regulator
LVYGLPEVSFTPTDRAEMSRTNIEIDDHLIKKAVQLTGAKSKREAVDIALRRLVEKGSLYRALRKLRGKLPWEGDVHAWRSAR